MNDIDTNTESTETTESIETTESTETTETTENTKEVIEVLEKINTNQEINIFCSALIVGLLIAILFAKGLNSNAK